MGPLRFDSMADHTPDSPLVSLEKNSSTHFPLGALRKPKLDRCLVRVSPLGHISRQSSISFRLFESLVHPPRLSANLVLLRFRRLLFARPEDHDWQEPSPHPFTVVYRLLHADRIIGWLPEWIERQGRVLLQNSKVRRGTRSYGD